MSKKQKKFSFKKVIAVLGIWFIVLSPGFAILFMLNVANDESLPDILALENPKTDLASIILTSDLQELGKYYHEKCYNCQ